MNIGLVFFWGGGWPQIVAGEESAGLSFARISYFFP